MWGWGEAMGSSSWLGNLEMLLNRYSYLGIGADIALMSHGELYGLYLSLSRRKANEHVI